MDDLMMLKKVDLIRLITGYQKQLEAVKDGDPVVSEDESVIRASYTPTTGWDFIFYGKPITGEIRIQAFRALERAYKREKTKAAIEIVKQINAEGKR